MSWSSTNTRMERFERNSLLCLLGDFMALTIVEALLLLGALVLAIFDGAVLYEKGVKY
ncbi:MAG: hypothetical protein ACPG4S_07860 [Schleiferiaceae bacterium]